jgi:hypothetical protein
MGSTKPSRDKLGMSAPLRSLLLDFVRMYNVFVRNKISISFCNWTTARREKSSYRVLTDASAFVEDDLPAEVTLSARPNTSVETHPAEFGGFRTSGAQVRRAVMSTTAGL